jgi:hypothetical protein
MRVTQCETRNQTEAASLGEKLKMVKVTRNSSVDLSQSVVVAEFATLAEAEQYIAAHTVDGVNVSKEIECDYLCIADDAE